MSSRNEALLNMLKADLEALAVHEAEDDADDDDRAHFARRRVILERQLALVEENSSFGDEEITISSNYVVCNHIAGYALFIPEEERTPDTTPFICFVVNFYDADSFAHMFSKPLIIVPAQTHDGGILVPTNPDDYDKFELLAILNESNRRVQRQETMQ